MILISSFGLCSPIIAEKAKKYIEPENKKVLVVPFAGYDNAKTADREILNGLIPFGFRKENIDVCDEVVSKQKAEKYDWIYVPGGNPFKLLKELEDYKIKSIIKEIVLEGCNYFGVSSGADLLSNDLGYLKVIDDCNYTLDSYEGLGILKRKILCHTDQRDISVLQKVKDFDGRKTLFLRNDEICKIPEEEMENV